MKSTRTPRRLRKQRALFGVSSPEEIAAWKPVEFLARFSKKLRQNGYTAVKRPSTRAAGRELAA